MKHIRSFHPNSDISPLIWNDAIGNSFNYGGMVRIRTIADGSCYFHAIANGYYIPYRTGISKTGQSVNRQEIVRSLRRDLAVKLGSRVDPTDATSPRYYDLLGRGQVSTFAKDAQMDEYSLENMQKILDSSISVDHSFHEFVSNQLNKDIYMLDWEKQDVYVLGDDDDLYYKKRPSLVLLYQPGHFELVGTRGDNGHIMTYFHPEDPFILAIRQRLQRLRALGSKR